MEREKIRVQNLRVRAHGQPLLRGVTISFPERTITGIMGPCGSGKTTLINAINRMIDFEEGLEVEGSIFLDGEEILSHPNPVEIRRRVGTVFALPVPLPKSIHENIAYGLRLKGIKDKEKIDYLVEEGLRKAFLWDEVKDRLHSSAAKLSGGQQQRLCLARTLALGPEVILLDEPTSGLDPISTGKIEEALKELKAQYTIIFVSNNTKQVARLCDLTAFFYLGELIEYGPTERIFTNPRDKTTEDYIRGRFG